MIYSHIHFKAVFGLFSGWHLNTCIVDEDIDTVVDFFYAVYELFDWFLVTQVQWEIQDLGLWIFLSSFQQNFLRFDLISCSKNNSATFLCKFQNCLFSNTSISTSDDDHLSRHVPIDSADTSPEMQLEETQKSNYTHSNGGFLVIFHKLDGFILEGFHTFFRHK